MHVCKKKGSLMLSDDPDLFLFYSNIASLPLCIHFLRKRCIYMVSCFSKENTHTEVCNKRTISCIYVYPVFILQTSQNTDK